MAICHHWLTNSVERPKKGKLNFVHCIFWIFCLLSQNFCQSWCWSFAGWKYSLQLSFPKCWVLFVGWLCSLLLWEVGLSWGQVCLCVLFFLVGLFVCLFVCLFICLLVCLFICLVAFKTIVRGRSISKANLLVIFSLYISLVVCLFSYVQEYCER